VVVSEEVTKNIKNVEKNSEAQGRIASAAAQLDIPTIIQVMQEFEQIPRVQSYGCQALADLAYDAQMKDKIAACGGIEVIMRALDLHRTMTETQEYTCTALWNLMSSHARNRDRVMQMGGVQSTLAAMKAHSDSAAVQEEACLVLYNLAYDRDHYRQVMVAEGGPDLVERALDLHSAQDHPTLHKYARWCLERLHGLSGGAMARAGNSKVDHMGLMLSLTDSPVRSSTAAVSYNTPI